MAAEGTEATDVEEPEQQRLPAPVMSPSGECAGSSPAGEQLGVECGESPSDSPGRAEGSGGESLIGEIPQLVAEALLDADVHASPLDNAAQAPGEDARDKQPSHRRRAGEQHLGRTAGRDFSMARQGGHGQNGSHLQAAKDYKNLDGRPSSGACQRREAYRSAVIVLRGPWCGFARLMRARECADLNIHAFFRATTPTVPSKRYKLEHLWKWFDQPYGHEVPLVLKNLYYSIEKAQSRDASLPAFYVPHLSAIQLFPPKDTSARNGQEASSDGALVDRHLGSLSPSSSSHVAASALAGAADSEHAGVSSSVGGGAAGYPSPLTRSHSPPVTDFSGNSSLSSSPLLQAHKITNDSMPEAPLPASEALPRGAWSATGACTLFCATGTLFYSTHFYVAWYPLLCHSLLWYPILVAYSLVRCPMPLIPCSVPLTSLLHGALQVHLRRPPLRQAHLRPVGLRRGLGAVLLVLEVEAQACRKPKREVGVALQVHGFK
jgi:hypothetical protein